MHIAKEYDQWRTAKRKEFQIMADKYERKFREELADSPYSPLLYEPPPKPDLSLQAFIEEQSRRQDI